MVSADDSRLRFAGLALVCIALFAALFARLWYLQVLNEQEYRNVAEQRTQRTLVIPAPRGRILDRNGKVLVDNRPTKVVAVDRQALDKVEEKDAVLSRLAALLNRYQDPEKPFTLASIKSTLAVNRVGPYDPVPLAQNIDDDLLIYLTEHSADYPGVVAETKLLRQYHYGSLAAQVLGRVGPISEEMWKKHEDDDIPYQKDAQVGVSGVEQSLEPQLRGTEGTRVVEVTPSGRIVRTVSRTEPVPGHDVQLTIDIDAQAVAEASLAKQIEITRSTPDYKYEYPPVPGGAAILMQPDTGQVLAMASYPSYDPNIFVPTITEEQWKALQSEDAHAPFTNRAVAGLYSPGSTFKLVTAVAGLRAGLITPGSVYYDNYSIEIQGCVGSTAACNKTNDRGDGALGPIALARALTKSSNVYFFDIGQKLWLGRSKYGVNAIQDTAADFGFGKMSGIELPDEKAVPLPTQQRNKELAEKYPDDYPNVDENGNWYTGTNMNVAVGQGDVLVTPLQLANAYGQLANGGDRYRPTILLRVLAPFSIEPGTEPDPSDIILSIRPEKLGHVDLPAGWRDALVQGFVGVTRGDGTASSTFAGFPLDSFSVAGKTGTAETSGFSDAFFVGFAPADHARYVAVAVLERAGYGSTASAPVVRAMFEPLATTGGWPTVEPVIASQGTRTATTTTTTVSGDEKTTDGGDEDPTIGTGTLPADAVPGVEAPSTTTSPPRSSESSRGDTTETTTPGSVVTGGR